MYSGVCTISGSGTIFCWQFLVQNDADTMDGILFADLMLSVRLDKN